MLITDIIKMFYRSETNEQCERTQMVVWWSSQMMQSCKHLINSVFSCCLKMGSLQIWCKCTSYYHKPYCQFEM